LGWVTCVRCFGCCLCVGLLGFVGRPAGLGRSHLISSQAVSYSYNTLEGNWQEERSRIEASENVRPPLLPESSYVREMEPDLSATGSGAGLECCERIARSPKMLDSTRTFSDDGMNEKSTMNQTFHQPIEERPHCPIQDEPNYHGTFGGPVQFDDTGKTRTSSCNRRKNTQEEIAPMPPGDARAAQTLVAHETLKYAMKVPQSACIGGFGSIVPRNPPPEKESLEMLSTSRASYVNWGTVDNTRVSEVFRLIDPDGASPHLRTAVDALPAATMMRSK